MIKIITVAILSDTHIRKNFDKIKPFLENKLNDIDFIIHAGDFTNPELLPYLKTNYKVIGVSGNNDKEKTRELLNEKEIFILENYKIGIYHGHGIFKNTLDNVLDVFKNDDLDIIIFGHSHKPFLTTKNNILIINPGSPTSKRKERFFSYIRLTLSESTINVSFDFFS